ncbi:hypothetical protein CEXT_171121 [Caerostris extrusa]|uniref:Uncharacterized protein n=1 Tax=Caerostris extrusa TaxID=172846 RepID=A0AAV4XWI4_CAEEX|nr:hypothetical protein CEXT_171121 [Caerostris extrusa]
MFEPDDPFSFSSSPTQVRSSTLAEDVQASKESLTAGSCSCEDIWCEGIPFIQFSLNFRSRTHSSNAVLKCLKIIALAFWNDVSAF